MGLEPLEEKINSSSEGAAVRSKIRFETDVSIIVAGLPKEDGENILAKFKQLFMKGKGQGQGNETQIVHAARLSGRGGQPGLVKVQCASTEEKIDTLHQNISWRTTLDIWKYVCSATSHTDQLIKLKFKTEIPFTLHISC